MYKKQLKKRIRLYSGVRNYIFDTHDADGNLTLDISVDEWKQSIIETFQKIDSAEIWFIFHDKDIISATDTEKEKIKPIHCHFVLINDNARWPKSVMEKTGTNEREIEKVNSISGSMRYLTHTTDKSMNERKHRYGISELYYFRNGVKMDDKIKREDYSSKIVGKEVHSEEETAFVNTSKIKILQGEILKSEIRKYFVDEFGEMKGSLLFLKKKKELYLVFDQRKEEYIHLKSKPGGRRLTTIYIEGPGNAGKTTLARYLCQYENLKNGFENEVFSSSGTAENITSDPFQRYDNEYSTILDEFMPELSLGFSDFNKYFNKTGAVDVASRNQVQRWLSDFCCIVKSRPLYQTIDAISQTASELERFDMNNVKMQIQRRIPLNLVVNRGHIVLKKFDEKTNSYFVLKEFKCSIIDIKELINFLAEMHEIIQNLEFEATKEFDIEELM